MLLCFELWVVVYQSPYVVAVVTANDITCYGCLLYHRCVDSAGTESGLMKMDYVLLVER